jgi:hypothetical protein
MEGIYIFYKVIEIFWRRKMTKVEKWSTHFGLIMTMSTKVRMSSLVSTMSTHQQEELNVVEGNTCNCSCPTWKQASHTMMEKVSQIASWVPMHSLPWAQHKKWIPIGPMGCVHTHRGMPTIKGWGRPSCIWRAMQKIRKNNRKVGKTNQVVNQVPILKQKHDKFEHHGL